MGFDYRLSFAFFRFISTCAIWKEEKKWEFLRAELLINGGNLLFEWLMEEILLLAQIFMILVEKLR